MDWPGAWGQESAGVEFALSELNLAHAALDAAEATSDAEFRRNQLAASRKAHTSAIHYLACVSASDEERSALQAQLRWLEVRMEKIGGQAPNHTAAA